MTYQVDENGRYRFPMLPGDRVRVVADCACGWGMDGPQRVWHWLSGRHAHAHAKGCGGLTAAGSWNVRQAAADQQGHAPVTAEPAAGGQQPPQYVTEIWYPPAPDGAVRGHVPMRQPRPEPEAES